MKLAEAYHREFRGQKIQHLETFRVFCPYRVCPLGAHSDHQHGLVTGFALDKGVELMFSCAENGVVDLLSCDFDGRTQFHVRDVPGRQGNWGDYLRGAVLSLARKKPLRCGVRGVVAGSLPVGGLSSSAAVTLVYLLALCRANEIQLTSSELIDCALHVENEYVGVNVGKLDQSCEVLCRRDQMLYLDTRDEHFELIARHPELPMHEIAIFFSGLPRSLVGSAFNARVDECKAAAYSLMAHAGMRYGRFQEARLREVPGEVFLRYRHLLPENFRLRAEHFYGEMARVQKGVEAWRCGDLAAYGQLVFESGKSSIENYQTGSPELKALYEIMLDAPGVYGGRFSGAGFRGCCMAITDPARRAELEEYVRKRYSDAFPQHRRAFSAHFCHSDDGARERI